MDWCSSFLTSSVFDAFSLDFELNTRQLGIYQTDVVIHFFNSCSNLVFCEIFCLFILKIVHLYLMGSVHLNLLLVHGVCLLVVVHVLLRMKLTLHLLRVWVHKLLSLILLGLEHLVLHELLLLLKIVLGNVEVHLRLEVSELRIMHISCT